MRYFLDQEFFEGFHKPLFGKRRHFIDLISIGLVAEDGREFYALSNEFDLEAVWYQYDEHLPEAIGDEPQRIYWLRDNVLRAIHTDLCQQQSSFAKTYYYDLFEPFTLRSMRNLITWHGKSNRQIAQDIVRFVCPYGFASEYAGVGSIDTGLKNYLHQHPPQFYGYYADYDWVLFCSIFGRMIDLPSGFPMFCHDLKQMEAELIAASWEAVKDSTWGHTGIEDIRKLPGYPKQTNEHHAAADARWNKSYYDFLSKIQIQKPV